MGHKKKGSRLRILIFRNENWFIAQCLEYDIAAQARTLIDVEYEFQRVFVGRIVAAQEVGIDPFTNIPPAPKEYHEAFKDIEKTRGVELKPIPDIPKKFIPPSFMLYKEAPQARLYDF